MTAATTPEEGKASASEQIAGFGTKAYRTYVLSALTLIYIMNFVDRGSARRGRSRTGAGAGYFRYPVRFADGFWIRPAVHHSRDSSGALRRCRAQSVDYDCLCCAMVAHDRAVWPRN